MVELSRMTWPWDVQRQPRETTCTRKNLANSSKKVQKKQRRKMWRFVGSIYLSTTPQKTTNSCTTSCFRRMRANYSSTTSCWSWEIEIWGRIWRSRKACLTITLVLSWVATPSIPREMRAKHNRSVKTCTTTIRFRSSYRSLLVSETRLKWRQMKVITSPASQDIHRKVLSSSAGQTRALVTHILMCTVSRKIVKEAM